jgi:SAM-dependent methyltransferase
MSVTFQWSPSDMQESLDACERNDIWPIIQAHIPKGAHILEHGCGVGQWVRFLGDSGWKASGIEFVRATVEMVRAKWPDLDIVEGDCAHSPYPDESFDAVLSFGVVEHWTDGPQAPLGDIYRVLKPGGVAVISVPCMNTVRKLKKQLWWDEVFGIPRAVAKLVLRRTPQPLNRRNKSYLFSVYPAWGKFFEYRMTRSQFRSEVERAGFEVVEQMPLQLIDGVYHELNPLKLLLDYRAWKFRTTAAARALDKWLSRWPYAHCHMQGIIARKPGKT